MKREIVYRIQINIDELRFKGDVKETYIILQEFHKGCCLALFPFPTNGCGI